MKIAQSNVTLVSSNHYYEENSISVKSGVVSRGDFLDNLHSQEKIVEEEKGGNLADSKTGTPQSRIEDNKEKALKNNGGESAAKVSNNSKTDIYESTYQQIFGEQTVLGSENYNSLRPGRNEMGVDFETSFVEQIAQIRARLLETLMSFLQILSGGNANRMGNGSNGSMGNLFGDASSMLSSSGMVRVTTLEMCHVEEEATSFSGQGIAKTEDGREIEFNVDFSLSRRLTKAAGISMASAVNFIDPLVINVGSEVTSISDQSFFFDLDCDGVEEKVAGLGAGSGFLAYDKNGDGVINDGSELFGTRSGDGFADLAEYDSDGNGWIDENDEVYGKLQVWLRGEDGVDRLLSLQEADVGAIYLGSATTEFTEYQRQGDNGDKPGAEARLSGDARNGGARQNGDMINRNTAGMDYVYAPVAAGLTVAAMMRASGLFLKESGGVGTVHQMDLARL